MEDTWEKDLDFMLSKRFLEFFKIHMWFMPLRESLQMIAEGVSEGLFHIPEDVFPQHITTTLDALKSVKNTSTKQFYTL